MVETPADPPQDLDEELEEFEDDLADVDSEIRALIGALRESDDASLRMAVQYSGDDSTILFVREDINEQYADHELEARVEALIVKGLGDPPREESLHDFGRLDATFRWYDEVLVAHFPYREWSGLAFTFDRRASPLVDLAHDHLRE
jgi:hypothetical protein